MSDLIIREPTAEEIGRVIYLFPPGTLRPGFRLWVAARSHPVVRFVGAAAWWTEGPDACFRLASRPGVKDSVVFGQLINQVAESARKAGRPCLKYYDTLPEHDPRGVLLCEAGFKCLHTERVFQVPYDLAWNRVENNFKKIQDRVPASWRIEAIRQHKPETALGLIPLRSLTTPEKLINWWRTDSAFAYDADLSSLLFDGSRPIGTLLMRKFENTLHLEIRVVQIENRLLRSFGNTLMFHFLAERQPPADNIRYLRFCGIEDKHQETANLAIRMGGMELPPRYFYVKGL